MLQTKVYFKKFRRIVVVNDTFFCICVPVCSVVGAHNCWARYYCEL